MNYTIIIVSVYVIGFVFSLVVLAKWGESFTCGKGSDYNDYNSREVMYLSYSTIWPLFWIGQLVMILNGGMKGLVTILINHFK